MPANASEFVVFLVGCAFLLAVVVVVVVFGKDGPHEH